MNEPTSSLSREQVATLQSILIFLEAVSTALDTQPRPTRPSDIELTKCVQLLGEICKQRLLANFPEIAEWKALGNGE